MTGSMNEYCGPFYYMPMPINADGNGPADPDETVKTLHEVWDQFCQSVCSCGDEVVARFIASSLNATSSPANRPTTL